MNIPIPLPQKTVLAHSNYTYYMVGAVTKTELDFPLQLEVRHQMIDRSISMT